MATATKKRTRGGIVLSSSELKSALAAVRPAVGRSKPILANVRIGDGLLTATDLEVRIDVGIDYHGEVMLLPHARLSAILAACGNVEEVTFDTKGTSCVVSCGNGTWTLPVEDASEFPLWEATDAKPVTRLPCDQFVRAVHAVAHSSDNESSRYALGAVLVSVNDGVVNFVATDGRRLSVAECEHDLAVDDSETLVPSRSIGIISSIAATSEDSVQLEASGGILQATIGGATVTTRLTEGRFPRWQDVIPADGPEPTTVLAADLLSATRAAAIVTSEQSKGVQYVFTADGLHLHAKSSEAGESSVTCGIVEFGHACQVKLDPTYVREWLQGLPLDGEPTVSVQAKDKGSAVVLRADSYTGVIMPLDTEG